MFKMRKKDNLKLAGMRSYKLQQGAQPLQRGHPIAIKTDQTSEKIMS
jgi:hypothetical protein